MFKTRLANIDTGNIAESTLNSYAYSVSGSTIYGVTSSVLEAFAASNFALAREVVFDFEMPDSEKDKITSIASNGENILIVGTDVRMYIFLIKSIEIIDIINPTTGMKELPPLGTLDGTPVSGVKTCIYEVVREVCLGKGPGSRKAKTDGTGIVETYSGLLPFSIEGYPSGKGLIIKLKQVGNKYLDFGSLVVDTGESNSGE